MKLAMTLLVKNETDIIKTHLEYHLPKVDILVIMDNLSTDGTYEYLKEVQSTHGNVCLLTVASETYNQHIWVSRMVEHAIAMGADWIINADADEFLVGNLKECIEKAHEQGYNQIYPKGSTFYTTVFDPIFACPVKRMVYRDPLRIVYPNDKVIFNKIGFKDLSQGNHWVLFNKAVTPKVLQTDEIRLFHYPERDLEQFVAKYAGNFSQKKISQMGNVWKLRHQVYKEHGLEGLKEIFNKECLLDEQSIIAKGLEKDVLLQQELISKDTK